MMDGNEFFLNEELDSLDTVADFKGEEQKVDECLFYKGEFYIAADADEMLDHLNLTSEQILGEMGATEA